MDFRVIAARIAREKQPLEEDVPELGSTEDILQPKTEYSCQIELSITATFEGTTSKNELIAKIKDELKSSIKDGLTAVARDLELNPIGALVKPIKLECAIVDQVSLEDEAEISEAE